jgi:hypothetical protein
VELDGAVAEALSEGEPSFGGCAWRGVVAQLVLEARDDGLEVLVGPCVEQSGELLPALLAARRGHQLIERAEQVLR